MKQSLRLRFSCVLFIFMLPCIALAQKLPDKNYFGSPVNIPILLSGNFGEIRSAHFHSGIDIKTQQVSGKPVFAAADGYVSRIKIQGSGYGKSLYISHPNGYTTVYAHLNDFIPSLAQYVKSYQYRMQQFEADIYPPVNAFRFRKGEQIGISGNTGNSGGPHLHFEIRDPLQRPVNALLFDFNITDNIKPVIENLAVYPVGNETVINGKHAMLLLKPVKKDGHYVLSQNPLILSGRAGFGLEAYDYLNGSGNRCTVYSIELKIDDVVYYKHEMERFSFDEVKYVSSHIDYAENILHNIKIHKLFPDPNNRLDIYKKINNGGIVDFSDDSIHHAVITVKDSYMNSSTLQFDIQNSTLNYPVVETGSDSSYGKIFYYNTINSYENPSVKIHLPANILFNDIHFTYSRIPSDSLAVSDTHSVHTDLVPLAGRFTLSVKTKNIPGNLRAKALLVYINRDNSSDPAGGTWDNGFITGMVNKFGRYVVMIDTTPPVIKPAGFSNNGYYKKGDRITFEITDDLAGIDTYSGTIDGHWALFEYDPKSNTLGYSIDPERIGEGKKHRLELIITDERKNRTVYRGNFND